MIIYIFIYYIYTFLYFIYYYIFIILVLAQHFPPLNLTILYKGGHNFCPKRPCEALQSVLDIFGTGTSVVIIQGAL